MRVERVDRVGTSRLRLTTVISSLEMGGAQRVMLQLCDSFAHRGHLVTLVTTDPEAADFFEAPGTFARVRAHPDAHLSCRWFDLRQQAVRLSALRRSLLETRPEVVLSFIDMTNISVLLALSNCDIPVIVSERTDPRRHSIGLRWNCLRRLAYPHARRVVFLADDIAGWGRAQWPRWRVEVIPNAVMPVAPRAKVVRSDGRKTVLGMGRLDANKRFDLLVRAFASIAATRPEWDLEIVGDGPERDSLNELIKDLSVVDRIRLRGPEKDPLVAFQRCDLFVLSSAYEGFPNVLAEAMAAGLPVISFNCPSGPSEIIRHEVDGLLVPALDLDALTKALGRLTGNATGRLHLASRAREVSERFSPHAVVDRWDQLIRDVLRERV